MRNARWSYSKTIAAAAKTFERMRNNHVYFILMWICGLFTLIPTAIIHACAQRKGQKKEAGIGSSAGLLRLRHYAKRCIQSLRVKTNTLAFPCHRSNWIMHWKMNFAARRRKQSLASIAGKAPG